MNMNNNKRKSPEEALPGVRHDAALFRIYEELAKGTVLTALDGITMFRTMHFAKYISILRNDYNISITTRWVRLDSGKSCKEYYLN